MDEAPCFMMTFMKLSEKGRYAPPPQLEPAAQRVSETIARWTGVHARTHWLLGDEQGVDGADFYFGEDELGFSSQAPVHGHQARPPAPWRDSESLVKPG